MLDEKNKNLEFSQIIPEGMLLGDFLETNPHILKGEEAFYLFETYGLPIEMIIELSQESGMKVDVE